MALEIVPRLLSALLVIILSARLLGALARRVGQPPVMGEITAGVLLGPTLFHGALTRALFPAAVQPSLSVLANVGVCIFMFFVGLHLDHRALRGQARIATTVSLCSIALPFGLGALLALYLVADHPTTNRTAFVLFVGTAMSITAFPVLTRILIDKGLIDTPIGALALACAAVDDVLAWSLLAAVAALAHGGDQPWRVLLAVPFVAVMTKVVRPLLARLARRHPVRSRSAALGVLVVGAIGLLMSSMATDAMALHPIFGAFLFGAVMPRESAPVLRDQALPTIEKISLLLLLPVFFLVAGLKVNLSGMNATMALDLALILMVAVGGKCVGAFVSARASGVRPRHSAVLALLINTRGLTELIVLTVGLQLAVLDQSLYSLMVVMALITTAMAGLLLPFVYPPELIRRDAAARAADSSTATGPSPLVNG